MPGPVVQTEGLHNICGNCDGPWGPPPGLLGRTPYGPPRVSNPPRRRFTMQISPPWGETLSIIGFRTKWGSETWEVRVGSFRGGRGQGPKGPPTRPRMLCKNFGP
jgi:hypothetical protein